MRLLIQHRSSYRYAEPARLGIHAVRLHPAVHATPTIEAYRLECEQAERIRWIFDVHGNRVARLSFSDERRRELEILVELAVELRPVNPFDFLVEHGCEALGFRYPDEYAGELAAFSSSEDPAFQTGPRFEALLDSLPRSGGVVEAIVAFNRATNAAVRHVVREEAGVWTPEQTLQHGRGSCRDSAVLLVALLRRRGIAARFASGYLIQLADEGVVDRDTVGLHAWAEAYLPGAGWIGLDATSGLLTAQWHIPLACAAAPALAAPLRGTADRAADAVEFAIAVARG